MSISNILQLILTAVTILGTAYALIRTRRMEVVEHASKDADASSAYAAAAKIVAEQWNIALTRIETLEAKGDALENKVDGLSDIVSQRDKCIDNLNKEIRRRDNYIAHLVDGIKILMVQLSEANITPRWTPRDWELTPRE